MVVQDDVEEQADNYQQQANIPFREEIDEHHIDYYPNNLLIDEVDSKEEETETSKNEDDGENQLMTQEELINYALTLDVKGSLCPLCDGKGTVELTNTISQVATVDC